MAMSLGMARVAGSRPSLAHKSLSNRRSIKLSAANFDESAAQVRRLLDRDRKDLNFDDLEKTFADPPNATAASADTISQEESPSSSSTSASRAAPIDTSSTSNKPMSPFGPSSTMSTSPFATGANTPSNRKRNIMEPEGLSPTMQPLEMKSTPWWTKITTTQIVIALSFTTIISLMIATFFFVLKVGAIRINE